MSNNLTFKQDPAADWTSRNPVLAQFEIGYESDTGKAKLGDGVTAWNSLGYWNPGASDHGALTGLADDDHTQYWNAARGAAGVRATTLTGLAAGSAAAIAATDTVLQAFAKLQAQIDGIGGGAESPLTLTSNGNSETPLTIAYAGTQTANPFVLTRGGNTVFAISPRGSMTITDPGYEAFLAVNDLNGQQFTIDSANGYVAIRNSLVYSFRSGDGVNEVCLKREAIDLLGIYSDLNILNGAGIVLKEMTTPAAPAANRFVLYGDDDGSGKTRVMVRFPTGAPQVVAIEL